MRVIRTSTAALGMGLALSLVAAPVLVAGTAGASVPSAATVTAPVSAKTVVLTNSSNGSSVLASKGELVVVKLSGDPLRWSEARAVPVTSAGSSVLVRVSGSTSTDGSSTTTFRVAQYGSAQVQATGTPICKPGKGCPQFVILWHATVVVPVLDPPGTAPRATG